MTGSQEGEANNNNNNVIVVVVTQDQDGNVKQVSPLSVSSSSISRKTSRRQSWLRQRRQSRGVITQEQHNHQHPLKLELPLNLPSSLPVSENGQGNVVVVGEEGEEDQSLVNLSSVMSLVTGEAASQASSTRSKSSKRSVRSIRSSMSRSFRKTFSMRQQRRLLKRRRSRQDGIATAALPPLYPKTLPDSPIGVIHSQSCNDSVSLLTKQEESTGTPRTEDDSLPDQSFDPFGLQQQQAEEAYAPPDLTRTLTVEIDNRYIEEDPASDFWPFCPPRDVKNSAQPDPQGQEEPKVPA